MSMYNELLQVRNKLRDGKVYPQKEQQVRSHSMITGLPGTFTHPRCLCQEDGIKQRGRGAHLTEIPSIQGHAMIPEVSEVMRQDLLPDVMWLYSICHANLLDHLRGKEGDHENRLTYGKNKYRV